VKPDNSKRESGTHAQHQTGVAAALVLLAAILAGTAGAADYPTRPIRYIVAFAPAGSTISSRASWARS
jgi:hypothetical protein